MNIEQYRQLKAEQEAQPEVVEQPIVTDDTQDIVEETSIEEETIEQPSVENKEEIKEDNSIDINGEKVSLEELTKGYLRQSDYTKKTQEVSNQRKEAKEAIELYENLKQSPHLIDQLRNNNINVPISSDPTENKVIELEQKMYEMMVEREIETLQSKYSDFEVLDVLKMADEKGLENLEDAYHLSKSLKGNNASNVGDNNNKVFDVEEIKNQLRQELLQELKESNVSTKTIISSSGGGTSPIKSNNAKLSEEESKVADMMGLTSKDYVKWRDADNK